ncbi:MAG: cytochrome c biogenesis protein [Planctomycetota bacterium]|jgi:cytochrome c-type biogenesis protein CcsB
MIQAETILFWVTLFVYVIAFCLHLFSFVSQKPRGVHYAISCLLVGLLVHTATGVVRWIAGGHPPVTDTYELNLTGTWFTVLIFVLFERLRKVEPHVGMVVLPVVFLVMGHGFMSRGDPVPMGPAYQSPWLVVHVVFAWLAFGCYAIATGAAGLLLLCRYAPDWKPVGKLAGMEPLDVASYRFIVLGFINHAVMLISGAIWAKKLWGRYWSWDALETWSLIAFLYFAFWLHVRTFFKWRLVRTAWLTQLGLLVMAISFWGVEWFAPTVHPGP